MKTVKAANGCRLTKGTQPYCWCQVHLFVSDWLLVCLLLSATFAVCCFTFLSLSVQPRCVYFSLSLSNKKGRNHTRQELISQAANSRSRWSIFFFPSKMKGPNESSDLICDPRRNRAHEIVFSSGRSTLSLYFSAFILLYLLLFWSPHIYLSESARGAAATPAPPGQQPASGLIQFCIAVLFLGARFTRLIFIAFFFFACETSLGNGRFSFCRGKDA